MKKLKLKQIDAFTDRAFTGNPAAVILDADGLTDAEMQLIAREMNLSETAFVTKPKDDTHDLELRWLTPTSEVNLCGHATIATFHAMIEEGSHGLDKAGVHHFRVKTKSGVLGVEVDRSTEPSKIYFTLPVPEFREYKGQRFELCNALQISADLLDKTLPVWTSDQGYVFIPFINVDCLLKMKPSFEDLKNLAHRSKINGFCAFTTETKHPTSAAHSRFFAPMLGINEDPVTGSAQGPLACYLYQNKRVSSVAGGTGKIQVTLEQGYEIGRGGRVWAELQVEGQKITSLRISGYAVTVMDGTLYV
ncbi:MAG: PhzF family phenazine biosynthesis protein [Rhizobacter sp.]|nr:PhzF family phenazine biosynthesis protein [Chlorobiales bacterium]